MTYFRWQFASVSWQIGISHQHIVVLTHWKSLRRMSALRVTGVDVGCSGRWPWGERRSSSLLSSCLLLGNIDLRAVDEEQLENNTQGGVLFRACIMSSPGGKEQSREGVQVHRWYGRPVGVGMVVVLMNDSRGMCVCVCVCVCVRETQRERELVCLVPVGIEKTPNREHFRETGNFPGLSISVCSAVCKERDVTHGLCITLLPTELTFTWFAYPPPPHHLWSFMLQHEAQNSSVWVSGQFQFHNSQQIFTHAHYGFSQKFFFFYYHITHTKRQLVMHGPLFISSGAVALSIRIWNS